MNPNTTVKRTTAIAMVAAAALLGLASVPAFAAVDCANPQGIGQKRACEIAPQGSNELRRFVERTSSIYLLSYNDFSDYVPARTAASEPNVKVASRK